MFCCFFFVGINDKMLPKPGFSKLIFVHPVGSTKLDQPYCKQSLFFFFWDKFGVLLGEGQAHPSFWEVPGLSRGSSPNFSGSFSATSPEVLSLWSLPAIQGFPGSSPDFPGSSPEVSRTSPEVSPFLWEAWHPLLTRKNFLWLMSRKSTIAARNLSKKVQIVLQ